MYAGRSRRVWSVWGATLAAICLLAFGSVPGSGSHSAATTPLGLATRPAPAAGAPAGSAAKVVSHPDAPVVTRPAALTELHLGFPTAAVPAAAALVALACWFVLRRRSAGAPAAPRRAAAPARAPPLAA